LTKDELKLLLQSPDPTGPAVSEEKLNEYLQLADTDSTQNFRFHDHFQNTIKI